ncbi:MAG: DUF3604 domain-containing protein [Proteobacteria bacterium]|nr:DUF3604 domain-containing protein [Pseudomonadota bacterium]
MRYRGLLLATVFAAAGVMAWGQSTAPGAAPPSPPAAAAETPTPPGTDYRSNIPAAKRRAFFGELHLHTAMSFDAWTFGTKLTPDDAYRYGRGEVVTIPAEQVTREERLAVKGDVKAQRPWALDFMAVTDHSENIGVLNQLDDPANPARNTPLGQSILKEPITAFYLNRNRKGPENPFAALNPRQRITDAWTIEMKAANDNYQPGVFTTLVAYEWTANAEGKYNLHRNVIFNGDHGPTPFTAAQSRRPEDLWTYLEKTRASGIDALAIPHNGNVSGGFMYDWNDSDGRPIDEHYAQRRALNEPLTEIVQNKGQSDTVPALSPNDEFANFEIFDHLISWPSIKAKPDGSYVRGALGRGLVIQSKVGANPYKFGFVGAADIHNGLSTSDESGMAGEAFGIDPRTMSPTGDGAKRALDIIRAPARIDMDNYVNHAPPTMENNLMFSSPGLTGVWAEENTRNAIFAALKRKETFATSGTRIRVRMFGGWGFDPKMIKSDDWVAQAYSEGVPMGSDLPAAPGGATAPAFVLQAVKDPDGANLDRIQIIKVWLENGSYKEKIFNVALSGSRHSNAAGHAPLVGNTVNLRTGAYTNTIGAAVLTTVWRDPEFDPKKPAVYYARVLEIPTPRWSTLLAIRSKLPIPKSVPATIQERAWTSPIWFTPT